MISTADIPARSLPKKFRSFSMDTLAQAPTSDHGTSPYSLLGSKATTTNPAADPAVNTGESASDRRFSGFGMLFSKFKKSGQSISDEEKSAMKQAKSLRRAQSVGFFGRKSDFILTHDYFKDMPRKEEYKLLASPGSPALQKIQNGLEPLKVDEIASGLESLPLDKDMADLDLTIQDAVPIRNPLPHDLSREIVILGPSFSPTEGEMKKNDNSSKVAKAKSNKILAFSNSRSSLMSQSRPEMAYYGNPDEGEIIEIEDDITDPFLMRVQANHRECMQSSRTSLPLSMTELKVIIARLFDDIDMTLESGDPKHLLLIPLNEASAIRWIKPGSRFRIGRNSPWLQAKSLVVSRNQCEVFHDINSFYICDVGSSSGTFLNGNRMNKEGQIACLPRALESGDILQLGVDFHKEFDPLGNLDLEYKCVQTLVLLGYPRKATVETPGEVDQISPLRVAQAKDASLISWKQIQKATLSARKFPLCLEGGNLQIFIKFEDFVHTDGAGIAIVFSGGEKVAYTAVFNNYKMHWEMAMTDSEGNSTIILDVLPNSTTAYSMIRDGLDVGRITATSPQKLIINPACSYGQVDPATLPLSPSSEFLTSDAIEPIQKPFYTISGDFRRGALYILQRSHTDRRQNLIGEAILSSRKSRWGKKVHMLEARLAPPEEHDQLLVIGALFTALLQI